MIRARRLFEIVALSVLACSAVHNAHADTTKFTGNFGADNSVFTYGFSTASTQSYTFMTTSFASGGFIPVLTLFNTMGGVPLGFAETDNSDVSFSTSLGAGSYLLVLTEDPNVFETNYAAGPLFAGSPTITGDLCGVSGGKFLNFVDCSQRTSSYALSVTSTTPTPEPSTWLLVAPAVALLFAVRYSRSIA